MPFLSPLSKTHNVYPFSPGKSPPHSFFKLQRRANAAASSLAFMEEWVILIAPAVLKVVWQFPSVISASHPLLLSYLPPPSLNLPWVLSSSVKHTTFHIFCNCFSWVFFFFFLCMCFLCSGLLILSHLLWFFQKSM